MIQKGLGTCAIIVQEKSCDFFFSISINLCWRSDRPELKVYFPFWSFHTFKCKGKKIASCRIFSFLKYSEEKGTFSSCGSFIHILLKWIDFFPNIFFASLSQSNLCVSDYSHQWSVTFLRDILQQWRANLSLGPHRFDNVKASVSKRNLPL